MCGAGKWSSRATPRWSQRGTGASTAATWTKFLHGKRKNRRQRFGCGRIFNALTGSVLARMGHPGKWGTHATEMADHKSVRTSSIITRQFPTLARSVLCVRNPPTVSMIALRWHGADGTPKLA
jgi:hypothetical protein